MMSTQTNAEILASLLTRGVLVQIGPDEYRMPQGPILSATGEVICDLYRLVDVREGWGS